MSHQHTPRSWWPFFIIALTFSLVTLPAVAASAPAPAAIAQTTEPMQVRVNGYAFDPLLDGEPALPAALTESAGGPALRLVQFSGPVRDNWLAALTEAGVVSLQYYPHNTFLVWADRAALDRLAGREFVRWRGDFHAAYKINADLQDRTGVVNNVAVLFYNDGDVQGTLARLAGLGATVLGAHPAQPDLAFYEAIVTLPAEAAEAVAEIATVWWLGYSSPEPAFDDEMSDQILAGNHSSGVPTTGYSAHLTDLGYKGAGITWAIIDTGVDYDHPDLGPHIVGGYNFPGACTVSGQPGTDCPDGGHGTHVAGIVGGTASLGTVDAGGFLYGLGMAPEVGLFAMNSLSAPAWPPTGGWQEHSKRALLGGAVGGNNSWTTGEGSNHGYQSSERTHDLMVRDGNFDTTTVAEPFIEVFSAGNSGPSARTLTAPKEAKNLIVTASSLNYRAGDINAISSFSSRGPSVDGRIVPTITSPGEDIASTANDTGGDCSTPISGTNGKYALCSGTSMASPHTSGAVALLADWWADTHEGAILSPAMAKAILVNSAVDMGAADIPNFNEGWGRINITDALAPAVTVRYFDQEEVLSEVGQQWVIETSVVDPARPMKVTLAWTDAPGAVGANPALVNNLNLAVTVNGTTYLGNAFAGGWSATGGSADVLNNVENVSVPAPSADITVVVTAANLPGDGIPYNADPTDQDFALVCQNCTFGPDFALGVQPAAQAVCAPQAAVFNLALTQIAGFNEPVTLSATGVPAGASASFSANPVTPPGSTVFTVGNTAAAASGTYAIGITGASASETHAKQATLTIDHAAPLAAVLVNPPANAVETPLLPTLSWQAVPGVTGYDVEVALDAGFASIVHAATVPGTSHTLPGLLQPDTQYYWRVRVHNACGETASAAGRFHTQGIACTIYTSTDIPKEIPRRGSVTSNLTISGSSMIKDLDVFGLKGSHADVGQLDFTLKSPANTSVQIMTSSCAGTADFDLGLDDEAAGTWPCPPTTGQSYKPSNPLSTFDGQSANGAWTLTVNDSQPATPGTLTGWGLNVCTASCGAAPAAGATGIGTLNATTARVQWAEAGAAGYEVWYAAGQPYFDPTGKSCAAPAPYTCATTSALSYDHGSLGSIADSYTYVIRAANACGQVNPALSNRVAEFEFALVAGAN